MDPLYYQEYFVWIKEFFIWIWEQLFFNVLVIKINKKSLLRGENYYWAKRILSKIIYLWRQIKPFLSVKLFKKLSNFRLVISEQFLLYEYFPDVYNFYTKWGKYYFHINI